MTEAGRPRQLRGFVMGVSAALFAGTVVELVAVEHYADRLQLIPFALCGLGLLALAAVWRRPGRGTVLALRGVMAAAAGSLVGVSFHVGGNLEFARELRPDAGLRELAWQTVTGGSPIGASGILLVGAALAIAATTGSGAPALAPEADRHATPRPASRWELGDAERPAAALAAADGRGGDAADPTLVAHLNGRATLEQPRKDGKS